jgi:hypothetical protein
MSLATKNLDIYFFCMRKTSGHVFRLDTLVEFLLDTRVDQLHLLESSRGKNNVEVWCELGITTAENDCCGVLPFFFFEWYLEFG